VYRIIALGDSSTLGVGVRNNETYCALLESFLNQSKNSLRSYEVINGGVAGYSSLQGLRYFKSEITQYQPDLNNDLLWAQMIISMQETRMIAIGLNLPRGSLELIP